MGISRWFGSNDKPEDEERPRPPERASDERIDLAIRRLHAKHNRLMCEIDDCDTLVILEEIERIRGRHR